MVSTKAIGSIAIMLSIASAALAAGTITLTAFPESGAAKFVAHPVIEAAALYSCLGREEGDRVGNIFCK